MGESLTSREGRDPSGDMSSNEARTEIARRVDALMIALLEAAEDDVKAGNLPSKHLAEYEMLCRAEDVRCGG